MAAVHTKDTVITVATHDLSTATNTSEFTRTGDKHDVTCYGKDDYVYFGGLKGGSFTMGGIYDSSASGPRAVLTPLLATLVAIVRRLEGTGTGLPQDVFSAILEKYTESSPVADMISWKAEFTVSDAVNTTAQ